MKKVLALFLVVCILGCLTACRAETTEVVSNPVKYFIADTTTFVDGYASVCLKKDRNDAEWIYALIDVNGKIVASDLNGFKDENGKAFYSRSHEVIRSDGYILMSTDDGANNCYFSLMDYTGKILYNYSLGAGKFPKDFHVEEFGRGCFYLRNTKNGDEICISGDKRGSYDFTAMEEDTHKVKIIGGGYVLTKTKVSNFTENKTVYTFYDYTGKAVTDTLDDTDKEMLFQAADDAWAYIDSDVVYWHTINLFHFYNFSTQKKFVIDEYPDDDKFDSITTRRRIYGDYNAKGQLLLCESRRDDRKPETSTVEIFALNTAGEMTSVKKVGFDGSVFKNYGSFYINGFDGAVLGNNDYTKFYYLDIHTGEIIDLCKDYQGKNPTRIRCLNAGLVGFYAEGEDGNDYGMVTDLKGNTIVEPTKGLDIQQVGPWIGVRSNANTSFTYYNEAGKVVFSNDVLLDYGNERFRTHFNYVTLTGEYLFSADAYYDAELHLTNN